MFLILTKFQGKESLVLGMLGTYHGATLLNENNHTDTIMKNRIKLEYYTTKKSINVESKEEITYGISIIKKEYCKNKVKLETNSVEKISTNKGKVKNIVKMLKDYKVTPIALEDVLEDIMKKAEYETA